MLDPEKVMLQTELRRLRLQNSIDDSARERKALMSDIEALDDPLGLKFVSVKRVEKKKRPLRCLIRDWIKNNRV